MPRFRPIVMALLVSLLAGCSTQRSAKPGALSDSGPSHRPSPEIVTLAPELVPKLPNPIESTPPSLATPTNVFADNWISFERWCRENGLPEPHKLTNAATRFEWDVPTGLLLIKPDGLGIRWNNLEVRLGYAPRLIDDRLFVNEIDAQKNLLPLVRPCTNVPSSRGIIVVDPGHGGENAGAKSVLGEYFEKTYTLDWAKRLAPLLEAQGWRVVLTRTNDFDLTLADRVAIAEREQAVVFLSLHFNSAAPKEEAAGLETYCLTPTGLPSSLTREYPDDLTAVFPNNAFDATNLQLAVRLHGELLRSRELTDRGVCRARFMGVLRGQNRPAVLIEGGYLSNRKEAAHIADPKFRQQLAEAVARALKDDQPVANMAAPESTETK